MTSHTGLRARRTLLWGLLCAAVGAAPGFSQSRSPQAQPSAIQSMYGPDLFRAYCASCHGRDGRGHGPAAAALKVPPSDLTLISARNGRVFPKGLVEAFVATGPMTSAHGSEDMPVWGPIFKSLDPSDARAKVRIANVVSYLESIQQK